MIAAIEALFGIKVPAWVVEAVLVLLLAGSATLYLEHRGATQELGKLQKSSQQLVAKANTVIKAETAQHAADVRVNQEKTDAALAANTALQSALDQRVRDFDTYRRAHPDVSRPSSGPVTASAGECGAQSCGDLVVRLAERGNELADSVGELSASLQSCQRDRDSLTGLPR